MKLNDCADLCRSAEPRVLSLVEAIETAKKRDRAEKKRASYRDYYYANQVKEAERNRASYQKNRDKILKRKWEQRHNGNMSALSQATARTEVRA